MYKFNKKNKIILIIIIILLFSVVTYYIYAKTNEEDIFLVNDDLEKNEVNTDKEIKEKEKIIVHIDGCVIKPGIVELEENSRISDAISAAGGLTENADISKINLAFIIEDGMKIYIPDINEQENIDIENNTQQTEIIVQGNIQTNNNTKVNINTASQAELETLPGIGSATALKIVEYRKENGKFSSIEDIINIKGIGNAKFEKIKEYICVK